MSEEAVRLLAYSIIQRTIADYVTYASKDKLPDGVYNFVLPYGGLRSELKSFFFSPWCDELLETCHVELKGSEVWRLLIYDKEVFKKAKKMIYYCTIK